ncbi:MAG: DUF1501 domain-containing protein [Bacteroidota bacterium]
MKRRDFLKASALASSTLMVPSFLKAYNGQNNGSRGGKNLVVVQLSGGNDGLNTIIPFQNDIYYQSRPSLSISKGEVLKINGEMGFNPALKALQPLYDQGLMSIVNSVGYPNPDRSHFRSMDIWHTASNSDEHWSNGWIGRYLDSQCSGCQLAHHALEVDDGLSLALKGEQGRGFAMSNVNQLKKTTSNRFLQAIGQQHGLADDHHNVGYLYKTLIDTHASADYLYQQSRLHKSKVAYPANAFGRDLKQIAELMTADSDIKIYYVSLTGFDTHVNQKNQQARLLQQYAEGMAAFVKDLQQNRLLDDTLIMTFSEFGRRVRQNASGGTDHGTANNLFLMGGRLQKPGFFNEAPDLSRLDQGDLIYQVDFRDIYASIIDRWLGESSKEILKRKFKGMPIV